MNANVSSTSATGKSQIESQMFINCTLDMDFLEVIKNESLRKYEENVYLLGTIFSHKEEPNEGDLISGDEDSSDEESLDDKIMELFDEDSKQGYNVQNEYMDQDERIQAIVSEIMPAASTQSGEDKEILKHLNTTLTELKENEKILNDNKENFKDGINKYEELIQRLKSIKNPETEGFFDEINQQADQLGILSETYKQIDNFIREKQKVRLNSELPWDMSHNIVISPL